MAGETGAVNGVQNLVQFLKLKGIEATEDDINSIFAESLEDGQEVLDNNTLVQELSQNFSLDSDDEELMALVGSISARDGVLDSVSYYDLNEMYDVATDEVDEMPECFKGKSTDKIQKNDDEQYYVTVDEFNSDKADNIDCISRLVYNIYGVSLYSDEGREIYQKLVEANPDILKEDYNQTVIHPNQDIVLVDISEPTATSPDEIVTDEEDNQEYVQDVTLSDEQVQEYAKQLHDAANGLFVADVTGINQMLDNSELTNDDWVNILNCYNSEYDGSFVQDVDAILSSADKTKIYDKMTQKLLESAQQGNSEAINLLCSEMYNATAGKLGTADEFVESLFNNATDEDLANIMDNYNAVTGSEIYKDIENDFSGETEQNYINRLQTAYQNAREAEYKGWDDGDLSIQDTASNFVTGVTDKVKEQVSGVVSAVTEHPVVTFGVAGAITGACIVGGPVVVAGVGLFGLGTAIYGGIKAIGETITGMNNYNNATTDAQAAEAMQDVGGSALEVGESAALAAMSAAQTVNAVKTAKNAASAAAAAANSADDAAKAAAQAGANSADDAAKAGAQAGANSADDAAKAAAQAGANSTDDAAKAGAQAGANSTDDAARAAAQAGANSADDAAKAAAQIGAGSADDAAKAGAQAGANSADDAAKAGAQAGANSTDDAAKAGAQAGAESADDGAKAGAQAGSQTNGSESTGGATGSTDQGTKAGANSADDGAKAGTNSADGGARAVGTKNGSGFTEWQQTPYAEQVKPLDDVLSQLNDIASSEQIQALQEAIKKFMLNPTDTKTYRKLVAMVHPDAASVEGLNQEQLTDITALINMVRDAVSKAA